MTGPYKDDNDRLRAGVLPSDHREGTRPVGSAGKKPATQTGPLSLGVAEFFRTCDEKVRFLLEPYIPAKCLVLVQGAPKAGKTWFAAWLAATVARQYRVVFVEEESAREVLRDRLKPFLHPDAEAFNERLRVIFKKRIRLDNEALLASLIAESQGADLIVLDPFVRLHSKREKEQDEMAIVADALQRLMAATGAAIVLVHHTRKGESWNKGSSVEASAEDARGSGVIAGEVDNIIAVRGVPQAERRAGEVRLIVENPASRVGAEFERKTAVIDLGGGAEPLTWVDAVAEKPKETTEELLRRVLAVLPVEPGSLNREALRDALRVKKDRMREAVELGLARAVIIAHAKGICRRGGPGPGPEKMMVGPGPSPTTRTADPDPL